MLAQAGDIPAFGDQLFSAGGAALHAALVEFPGGGAGSFKHTEPDITYSESGSAWPSNGRLLGLGPRRVPPRIAGRGASRDRRYADARRIDRFWRGRASWKARGAAHDRAAGAARPARVARTRDDDGRAAGGGAQRATRVARSSARRLHGDARAKARRDCSRSCCTSSKEPPPAARFRYANSASASGTRPIISTRSCIGTPIVRFGNGRSAFVWKPREGS